MAKGMHTSQEPKFRSQLGTTTLRHLGEIMPTSGLKEEALSLKHPHITIILLLGPWERQVTLLFILSLQPHHLCWLLSRLRPPAAPARGAVLE